MHADTATADREQGPQDSGVHVLRRTKPLVSAGNSLTQDTQVVLYVKTVSKHVPLLCLRRLH